MKYNTFFLSALLLLPATTNAAGDLQTIIGNFSIFLRDYVILFLLVVAFLFFIINVARYFIIGGSNEDGQENAKALAIYGVSAFVLIVIFWGLINFITGSLGFGGESAPDQDYVKMKTP